MVKSGPFSGQEAPLACRFTNQVEGNYIRELFYDRFKLQKDSDGMLNLTFLNKARTKTLVKRCTVVPDNNGIADVVFGKEPPKTPGETEDVGVEDQPKGTFPLLSSSTLVLIDINRSVQQWIGKSLREFPNSYPGSR